MTNTEPSEQQRFLLRTALSIRRGRVGRMHAGVAKASPAFKLWLDLERRGMALRVDTDGAEHCRFRVTLRGAELALQSNETLNGEQLRELASNSRRWYLQHRTQESAPAEKKP